MARGILLLSRALLLVPAFLMGCTKVLPSNLAALNLSANQTVPAITYVTAPLPVAWYKFDETSGTTSANAMGGTAASLVNASMWTVGNTGNAVSIGASTFPQVSASPAAINLPVTLPASFTLSFWVKPSGFNSVNSGGDSNFLIGAENYQANGFRAGFTGIGQFNFWTTESGGTVSIMDPSSASVGVWTQYVVSYQNQIATMFKNGVLVARTTGTFIPTTKTIGIDSAIYGAPTFWGAIDDLRIFNQALTPQDISSGQMSFGTFGSSSTPLQSSLSPTQNVPTLASYFGMTIHRLFPNSNEVQTPFPAFPFQTFRLWDVVNWSVIQPSQSTFSWTKLDGVINVLKQNGVSDMVFTLGTVPTWASSAPSHSCPEGAGACDPPNAGTVAAFLPQVVQRYCGVIKYWETWNEPNGTDFWTGTYAQLLDVSSQMYQIVKNPANCGCTNGVCSPGGGANPNQVVLSSISNLNSSALSWLDGYLASAGSTYPYADISGLHAYGYSSNPESVIQGITGFKQVVAQHGMSALPVWDTEVSWGTTTTSDSTTQASQASWIMRLFMAQLTADVSRTIWYAYDNCGWGTLWGSACDGNGNALDTFTGIRQPGTAYATLQNWIVGSTLKRCEVYQSGMWACLIQKNNYTGWILWSAMGNTVSLAAPAGMTDYRDWQNAQHSVASGGTVNLGSIPILLEN